MVSPDARDFSPSGCIARELHDIVAHRASIVEHLDGDPIAAAKLAERWPRSEPHSRQRAGQSIHPDPGREAAYLNIRIEQTARH